MIYLEPKLGIHPSCICKNLFSLDLRFVSYLPSLCRNNDCCVYPWNQTDDPSQDEKLKSFCFVFALSRLASNLFTCVCVLLRTASIITIRFWLCFCHSIIKVKRYELLLFISYERQRKTRFGSHVAKLIRKHNSDASMADHVFTYKTDLKQGFLNLFYSRLHL